MQIQDKEKYEKFLNIINSDLDKIFNHQREYLYCKEGCSFCCERGDYPISKLEYEYMMVKYEELDNKVKETIKDNIEKTKQGDTNSYVCPFLIEHKCSIYENRPIVCRTFGVLTEDAKGEPSFPFCATIGLNYSQIYDEETKHLVFAKVMQNNFEVFPKIFRLNNKVVMNLPLAKKLELDFGELKKMIDFL